MSLAHLLMRQASQQPDREAVYYGTALHSILGQWAARSATLAQHFRKSGLLPGDRIVLFMRNHPRYLEILWAAWWAGLIVVPVNAKLRTREVEWIVDNAQARWAFVTGDVAPGPLAGLERQIALLTPPSCLIWVMRWGHSPPLRLPPSSTDWWSMRRMPASQRRIAPPLSRPSSMGECPCTWQTFSGHCV